MACVPRGVSVTADLLSGIRARHVRRRRPVTGEAWTWHCCWCAGTPLYRCRHTPTLTQARTCSPPSNTGALPRLTRRWNTDIARLKPERVRTYWKKPRQTRLGRIQKPVDQSTSGVRPGLTLASTAAAQRVHRIRFRTATQRGTRLPVMARSRSARPTGRSPSQTMSPCVPARRQTAHPREAQWRRGRHLHVPLGRRIPSQGPHRTSSSDSRWLGLRAAHRAAPAWTATRPASRPDAVAAPTGPRPSQRVPRRHARLLVPARPAVGHLRPFQGSRDTRGT